MDFFVRDGDYVERPLRPDVVRLLHRKCNKADFRRVPPDRDASIFEVGQDSNGNYFTREPLAGHTSAREWSPAQGKAACNACWDGQNTENPVFDFDTREAGTE